ncbi:hypothetical protein CLU79DRAFT_840840, partial [Phycomyces nitens]
MPPNSTRSRANREASSSQQVTAGRIEDQQFKDLFDEVKTVQVEIATVNRRLGMLFDTNKETKTAVSNLANAHANSEARMASFVPIAMAPAVVSEKSISVSDTGRIILGLIKGKMWKKNLDSDNPGVIAENNSRKRWNENKQINHPDNVAIISYLKEYILSQPEASGFWPDTVVNKIKNNYKHSHRKACMTPEQDEAKKQKGRSNSRIAEILRCRIATYKSNWRVIDEDMGDKPGNAAEMAYLHVLKKEVMSDGESETE